MRAHLGVLTLVLVPAIVLLSGASDPGIIPEEDFYVRGDCDGDGSVGIADAIFTLEFLFARGAPPPCARACDTDGDRAIVLSDPIRTLLFLFAEGPAPVPPFPGCGGGEEGSPLSCERYDHCS